MTPQEIATVLDLHGKWLCGDPAGRRANLGGSNLGEANLRWADLRGADLHVANLSRADLHGANLIEANLSGANLIEANLSWADLSGADLSGANLPTRVVVFNIDCAILKAAEGDGCRLNMGEWHTCETTHCRAGWAITLAGLAGKVLEEMIGPCAAGALIYAASRPGRPVPDFYANNEDAMADLRACAAEGGAS